MTALIHRYIISVLVALSGLVLADDVTVGREGIVSFEWSGEPLRTVDQTLESPFYCEILSVKGEGDTKHYEMSYVLLEPGKHNLNSALLNVYGRPVDGLPDIWVSATTLLPEAFKGELLPYPLAPVKDLDGFSSMMFLAAGAWVLVGIGGLYMFRSRKEDVIVEAPSRGPTVADLLRPLVIKAASDSLTAEEKARLNRILFRFWQIKLGLADADPVVSLQALRAHDQAGALLTCLDRWLYSPEVVETNELEGILEPYCGSLAGDLHLEDLR